MKNKYIRKWAGMSALCLALVSVAGTTVIAAEEETPVIIVDENGNEYTPEDEKSSSEAQKTKGQSKQDSKKSQETKSSSSKKKKALDAIILKDKTTEYESETANTKETGSGETAADDKSGSSRLTEEEVKQKRQAYIDDMTTGKCGENITYTYDKKTGILYLKGEGELYDYKTYAEFPWVLWHDTITSTEIDGDINFKLWMCNETMAVKSNHDGDIDGAVKKIYREINEKLKME